MSIAATIAGALILLGVWFYGKKDILGPGFSMAGCILWFWIGIQQGMFELAVLNAVLFTVNTLNFGIWYRNREPADIIARLQKKEDPVDFLYPIFKPFRRKV